MTGGNPYAPRVSRTTSVPEQESELDGFVRRLRNLGATDEEVAVVRETWDELDENFTIEQRTAVTLMGDDELRAELEATREEYRHDTRTETEQGDVDAAAYQAQLRADASEWIGQPVKKVLDRIGDDVVLALVVLSLETGPDGASRKSLVGPLEKLVAGSDPAGIPVEIVTDDGPPTDVSGEPVVDDARGGDAGTDSPGEPDPG